LPDACVQLLERASLILHVGDFTSAETLAELRTFGQVEAVHGNMDDPALKAGLPERLVVEAGDARIGLVHDGGPAPGRPERLAAAFPACAIVVYGHSHWPELTRIGRTWIVNPGSATERRRAPAHTMAVVRRGRPELVRLD
jgi:putative phosphoesterase